MIHRRGPPGVLLKAVEFAVLEWVDRFNQGACSSRSATFLRPRRKRAIIDKSNSRHGGLTQTKPPPGNPVPFSKTPAPGRVPATRYEIPCSESLRAATVPPTSSAASDTGGGGAVKVGTA